MLVIGIFVTESLEWVPNSVRFLALNLILKTSGDLVAKLELSTKAPLDKDINIYLFEIIWINSSSVEKMF
ncbi:hypothetical protein BpHYR1_014441 [Brachionus plicatilis]|uniref:Uncharacterized protein n=1 Tax=Brachionus plicatilis TaxID=10195 RepID=A0A3M7RJP1_BRAPC|nr:hypothetical protein BpHYR1_014441 [Brachionus plicatilis]